MKTNKGIIPTILNFLGLKKSSEPVNDVKFIFPQFRKQNLLVEDTIENGVKKTSCEDFYEIDISKRIEDVIENGVKETKLSKDIFTPYVEDTIENGIVETYDDVYHHKGRVEGVIKNGVKEVQPLPTQDGNKDWGNYYHRQEDRTKPHTEYVNDAVRDGVKETWGYDKQSQVKVENVVENGKKI